MEGKKERIGKQTEEDKENFGGLKMSLVGVYPDTNLMNRDQLLDYITFIEAQAVTNEYDLREKVKYYKKCFENVSARLKELEQN